MEAQGRATQKELLKEPRATLGRQRQWASEFQASQATQ